MADPLDAGGGPNPAAPVAPSSPAQPLPTPPPPPPTRCALTGGRVLLGSAVHDGLAVIIDGACIAAIVGVGDARLDGLPRHELDGRLLMPGFIDTQVNGGGDVLFNDAPTVDSLRRIAAAHRRYGTTGFLPTLITDTPEVMQAAVAAVDAAMAEGVPGVLGVHLEGPFLNPSRKGIHDAAKFRRPDADDFTLLARPSRGVTMLTLAPERVTPAFIARAAQAGVVVSAGHTAADHATIRAALDAGMRGFTHLYNAMTPLLGREPGAVGAALDDRESWCGLIVDGHHVHPVSLRVAIAAKRRGRMMLVTDAMPPVGGVEPDFLLDGVPITTRDGICRGPTGTLAGSALDMASALRNTVRLLGVPLPEASRMASAYPAEFLGLAGSHGRIAPGLRADLAVLDEATLEVVATWIGGEFHAAAAGA